MPYMEMADTGRDLTLETFKAVGMVPVKEKNKIIRWDLPPGYVVYGSRVLLATYRRPEKTKGGIILTDKTKDEEENQGKACLVIGKGPGAFVSDENYDFRGLNVEVGDWVAIWVYEARPMVIEGHPCRVVRDQDIIMKIPVPDRVF
jgi:co-chaperonin GroES (HSP10)